MFAAIKLGSFGLLLPMYFTVAHRMFPFFAGNVVPGYRAAAAAVGAGRVLGAGAAASGARAAPRLRLAVAAPICRCCTVRLGCCGAGGRAVKQIPALLRVLFVGFAWLPVAFALYAAQSAAYAHDRRVRARPRAGARAVHRLLRQPAGGDGDARDAGPFRPAAACSGGRRGSRSSRSSWSRACASLAEVVPDPLAGRRSPPWAGCSHSALGAALGLHLSVAARRTASAGLTRLIEFYPQIKWVHIAAVLASGALFALRGAGAARGRSLGDGGAAAVPELYHRHGAAHRRADAATILPGSFANGWLTAKVGPAGRVRRARQLRAQARPYARRPNRLLAGGDRCLWTDHQRCPCSSSARIAGRPDAIVEYSLIVWR